MTTDKENRLDGENTQSGRDGYKSYNKEGYNRYNRNEGRSYGRRPYGSNREGGERPYRSSYNPRFTGIMERIVHSAVMEIILSSAVMETDRDITAIRIVPRVLPMCRAITIMKEVSSARIVRVIIITREVNSARSVRVTTTVSSSGAAVITSARWRIPPAYRRIQSECEV